ncbi:MAG: type II and III secretion system protein [Bryobacteraceae bacterium]|nr:type II and III secretion system protein [Bryobacteraceae bacterium]
MQKIAASLTAVVLAGWLCAADRASALYREARRAEKRGDYAGAYLKASQAVALAPAVREYWNYSQAMRTRALAVLPPAARPAEPAEEGGAPLPPEWQITAEDLAALRELAPPPVLRGSGGRKSFRMQGTPRVLFEQAGRAYGIEVVFDREYPDGPPAAFRLDAADWREAFVALENVTGSFVIPLAARRAMVAKDTPQKRAELEPVVNVLFPLPDSLKTQDVQEMARAVQSAFDITRVGFDLNRRVVLFRDRVSKLKPAILLFEQLLAHRGQVTVEVELLSMNETSTLNLGLLLRSSYPAAFAANPTPFTFRPQPDPKTMAAFGGGRTAMAVTVLDGELFAALVRGRAQSVVRSEIRSLDGESATVHIGDRYPIITQGFFGRIEGEGPVYRPPPTVQFEELGIVLKVTPRVHDARELTLDLEAEFKSLAGEALNGIPVISNRKFASRLRAQFGEVAVLTGVVSESISQSWSGLPVLSLAPGLKSRTRALDRSVLLLTVRPRLEALPPVEMPTFPIRTGSEARPLTPYY